MRSTFGFSHIPRHVNAVRCSFKSDVLIFLSSFNVIIIAQIYIKNAKVHVWVHVL